MNNRKLRSAPNTENTLAIGGNRTPIAARDIALRARGAVEAFESAQKTTEALPKHYTVEWSSENCIYSQIVKLAKSLALEHTPESDYPSIVMSVDIEGLRADGLRRLAYLMNMRAQWPAVWALRVLELRTRKEGMSLDMNLSGADLSNIDWGAWKEGGGKYAAQSLVGCTLVDTKLVRAKLNETDFSLVDMRGADLSGANLRGAILRKTNLTGADLSDADLSDADLSGAVLDAAILTRTKIGKGAITGASLVDTKFNDVDFSGRDRATVDISRALADNVTWSKKQSSWLIPRLWRALRDK